MRHVVEALLLSDQPISNSVFYKFVVMLNQAALPRIVPWTGWAEWQAVYGWLYSEDAAWRSMAVKRVRTHCL
jgi:hypothetical protein